MKTENTEAIFIRQLVQYLDLGLISYAKAWKYQTELNAGMKAAKRSGSEVAHYLLFCEHPPVYTLGKSGTEDHLKISDDELQEKDIEFFRINRGGDITYHGPGQLVGYPIFDLDRFFTDVHRYVRSLEEAVIRTLKRYELVAGRISEFTGVWLDVESPRPRKICAIGVHMSRWVTMHGFAFNINTNLDYYQNIVPCGIDTSQKPVTSLARELGHTVNMQEVKSFLKEDMADVFGFDYVD